MPTCPIADWPLLRLVSLSHDIGGKAAMPSHRMTRFAALNEALGVTGLVLCHGDRYLHYLEGLPHAVIRAFEAVQSDPLHERITLLKMDPADRRLYAEPLRVLKPAGDEIAEVARGMARLDQPGGGDPGAMAMALLWHHVTAPMRARLREERTEAPQTLHGNRFEPPEGGVSITS